VLITILPIKKYIQVGYLLKSLSKELAKVMMTSIRPSIIEGQGKVEKLVVCKKDQLFYSIGKNQGG